MGKTGGYGIERGISIAEFGSGSVGSAGLKHEQRIQEYDMPLSIRRRRLQMFSNAIVKDIVAGWNGESDRYNSNELNKLWSQEVMKIAEQKVRAKMALEEIGFKD